MLKRKYELNGYGNTSVRADSDLKRKEKDLVSKLTGENVSTDISDNSTLYSANYTGKSSLVSELVCPEFTIQSKKGWDYLVEEAKKRANGGKLSSYDVEMAVKKTYMLSDKQIDAATGRIIKGEVSRSSPAGIDSSSKNYLVKILNKN